MKVARPVWGWGRDAISRPTPQLIGDVPSATAILDRFLHHAEIIAISGKSYRLRNQIRDESATPATDDSEPAIAPTGSATRKKSKQAAETAMACES